MREADYYAPGSYYDPSAPWNQVDVPEKEFEVTCSQSLSKTVSVWTNNYTPGAEGVDYEPDDEGGYYASAWHDDDDTSDTDWKEEYCSEHFTPIQLIQKFKEFLEEEVKVTEEESNTKFSPIRKMKKSVMKHLINECSSWVEDETEVIEN